MYERPYLQEIKKRLSEKRKFMQVIVGPRQVGKTTMILQLLDQIDLPYTMESADAVISGNSAWVSQVWDSTRVKMELEKKDEYLIVFDEIQKIDNWSEIVKQQWDKDTREKTNIKVILLGSSRLLIQKGLSESLAGRFETIYTGHWSFAEMQQAFNWSVDQYVYFGGYPGPAELIEDETRWKKYITDALIETSISKDILMLTRVDKPALLKRLFETGSVYSGQILSFTKILGMLQDAGNTTTLSNYLTLLSDSGLLGGIEKYAGDIARRRSSAPKFQVHNNALLTAQLQYHYPEVRKDTKEWGRMVESSVGSHLINHSISEKYSLYYWRERNDEVDYVMEWNDRIIALEVKSGKKQANRGMTVFASKFRPFKVLLIGAGGIPPGEFLKMNPIELFSGI